MKSNASNIFRWVVDDVIAKTKPEFVQEGVDEGILDELRRTWESKLVQNGLIGEGEGNGTVSPAGGYASGSQRHMQQASVQHQPPLVTTSSIADAPDDPHARKRKEPETGFAADQEDVKSLIPQHDGPADDEGNNGKADGSDDNGGDAPAEDEILSEDSENEDDDEEVANFLCCQFEKVNRTKNRWKISMKDGVFHIDGKDYLFKKANAELTF
mmetsp:Transcript_33529/g.74189  ORF Transcript_33529/g.74189 Transcript_33529/m.74189 type:complete len:213 (+) Transcript_33529:1523-2161(+)